MTDRQVLVGKVALGELITLARRAAFSLRSEDPVLADALRGCVAEVELTTYAAVDEPVCC